MIVKKMKWLISLLPMSMYFEGINYMEQAQQVQRIMENTKLDVHRFMSGPLGGDQQIGAMVAQNEMDLIIFLRDPLMAQPHEPDIIALLRLCDVQGIPCATNIATAEILSERLDRGDFAWRELVHKYKPGIE